MAFLKTIFVGVIGGIIVGVCLNLSDAGYNWLSALILFTILFVIAAKLSKKGNK